MDNVTFFATIAVKTLPSQEGLSTRFACNKDVFHWQNDGLTYRPDLLSPFLLAKIDLSILAKEVWTAIVFVIVVLFVFVSSILAKVSPVAAYLNLLAVVVPALIGIVVRCLLREGFSGSRSDFCSCFIFNNHDYWYPIGQYACVNNAYLLKEKMRN